jgi:hypothetical protein
VLYRVVGHRIELVILTKFCSRLLMRRSVGTLRQWKIDCLKLAVAPRRVGKSTDSIPFLRILIGVRFARASDRAFIRGYCFQVRASYALTTDSYGRLTERP